MAAGDLTDLANVRSFLQKPEGDVEQDAIIEALITQASAVITRETGRQFVPDDGVTRTFEVAPRVQGQLTPPLTSFAPFELRDLTEIKLDVDTASPTKLEAEEFRLWPTSSRDGTYFGVKLNPLSLISPAAARWGARREISVKGDWGMAAVPDDVVNWCNITVALWLRRDVAAFETGLNIDSGYLERPRSLPSAAASALDAGYTRKSVA